MAPQVRETSGFRQGRAAGLRVNAKRELGVRLSSGGFFAPLLLLIAGCGTSSLYVPQPANNQFSITPATDAITTTGQVRLRATLPSGQPAAVSWTVAQGQNDLGLGEGRIDATGVYTPPSALSKDSVQVLLTAHLQSDPTRTATAVVSVTPGFLQPLTPETGTLAPGASLKITGKIAEVNGGNIVWKLARTNGTPTPQNAPGQLSSPACERTPQNYTICSVVYTAPFAVNTANDSVSVIAAVAGSAGTATSAPVNIRLSAEGITSTPLPNQAAQAGPVVLGGSGGNNSDYDADSQGNVLECCGGTLGALLTSPGGAQYILSNNHVLAESDQASSGDTILQPGLIDSGCAPHPGRGAGRPVGALRYYVPLATPQSNVDAALALVNPGAVQMDGAILQLGLPISGSSAVGASLSSAPPAAGRGEVIGPVSFGGSTPILVAKSGRTTGLTCSTVDAIDLAVEVDYFKDCAETQPYYTKTFTDQLGIPGNAFADSGDSGALIVDSRNAEPVGLLFATGSDDGGTGYSAANPIADVLTELGSRAGQQLSVVGGPEHPVACMNYNTNDQLHSGGAQGLSGLSPALLAKANAAVETARTSQVPPGILGVAVGRSEDNPREPAVIVYVARGAPDRPLPALIGGVRTIVVPTDAAAIANGSAPLANVAQPGIHLPATTLTAAVEVERRYAKQLMADPAIFGVGVTQSYDNPAEAALLVLVDAHRTAQATPAVIGGLRIRYISLNRLHVTRSKYAGIPIRSTCSAKPASTESLNAFRVPQSHISLP